MIASLIYLGIQIRGSNKQSRAQTFHLVASEQARLADAIVFGIEGNVLSILIITVLLIAGIVLRDRSDEA